MAGAVGGVDLAGAPGKLAQMRLGLAQFDDPPLHLDESLADELADVLARGLAAGLDVEDLADLAQREPPQSRHRDTSGSSLRSGRTPAQTPPTLGARQTDGS
jgi:hypothetical protein